jgi:hypothetical protein
VILWALLDLESVACGSRNIVERRIGVGYAIRAT